MTAVVSTYVPEQGFVIGTDSLRRDSQTGGVIAENARKVFSIEEDGIRLAYAWAGATSMFSGWGQEFSFVDETARLGNELAINKPESIDEYVRQFAIEMHRSLRATCLPDGRLTSNPHVFPREEIARVLLVGYYNGKPYRTGVRFLQKDLRLQSPFMDDLIESPNDFNIFSGSAVILEQFQPMEAPKTLKEATELIRRYIQSCIDNRNNFDDCKSFGGRVHIATVTQEQFDWSILRVV